jgi:hypothetical protein
MGLKTLNRPRRIHPPRPRSQQHKYYHADGQVYHHGDKGRAQLRRRRRLVGRRCANRASSLCVIATRANSRVIGLELCSRNQCQFELATSLIYAWSQRRGFQPRKGSSMRTMSSMPRLSSQCRLSAHCWWESCCCAGMMFGGLASSPPLRSGCNAMLLPKDPVPYSSQRRGFDICRR